MRALRSLGEEVGGALGKGGGVLVQSVCILSMLFYFLCCVRSDIGQEVGFEAVGIIDSKLPTTGVWARKSDEVLVKNLIEATDIIPSLFLSDGRSSIG